MNDKTRKPSSPDAVALDWPSQPAISFPGEAGGVFDDLVDRLAGYGVTITLETGETVEAVLIGADHDAGWYGTVRFYRVVDEDYPSLDEIPASKIETGVAAHIEVS